MSLFFKKTCTGDKCITIKGPPVEQVQASTYTFGNDKECYQFVPYLVSCDQRQVTGSKLNIID